MTFSHVCCVTPSNVLTAGDCEFAESEMVVDDQVC